MSRSEDDRSEALAHAVGEILSLKHFARDHPRAVSANEFEVGAFGGSPGPPQRFTLRLEDGGARLHAEVPGRGPRTFPAPEAPPASTPADLKLAVSQAVWALTPGA